jgi:hypothetical protein
MRNLLLVAIAVFTMTGMTFAACQGPYCYDETKAYMDKVLEVPTSGLRLTTTESITVGVSTPSASGLIGIDSSYNLYISSGTGRGAWIKIGTQS